MVAHHEAVDALDAVIDVHERAGLLAVAPDLDLRIAAGVALAAAEELGVGRLPAHRGGGLLAAALPRALLAVDVVEADGARLDPVLLAVVIGELLGDQLLPAVGVLRLRGVGVLLLQRYDLGLRLEVLGVDARARRVEVALHAVQARRLHRVRVDEDVVVEDLGVVLRDEAHPPHVGREGVDVLDRLPVVRARGLQAVGPAAEVQQLELVGARLLELGPLDVDAADPVALVLEVVDEVVADEATSTGHEDAFLISHN